jgi:NAD(P)-dependent dehydrogenase (short-subunit alcohol dehydrogenase family)
MAAIAVICTTGSSDGIGHATPPVLVAGGHRVLIRARNRDRGRPVLETTLVTGDLVQLDEVHRLADQIHANGPVDARPQPPVFGRCPQASVLRVA